MSPSDIFRPSSPGVGTLGACGSRFWLATITGMILPCWSPTAFHMVAKVRALASDSPRAAARMASAEPSYRMNFGIRAQGLEQQRGAGLIQQASPRREWSCP